MIIIINDEIEKDGDIEPEYYEGPDILDIWNQFWAVDRGVGHTWDKELVLSKFREFIISKGFKPAYCSIFPFYYDSSNK